MEPVINRAIKAALDSRILNPTDLDGAIHFIIGYIGYDDPALADLLTQLIAKTK